jgi:hypothetical protein
MFFSEGKNQKTFCSALADRSGPWPAKVKLTGQRVFRFRSAGFDLSSQKYML